MTKIVKSPNNPSVILPEISLKDFVIEAMREAIRKEFPNISENIAPEDEHLTLTETARFMRLTKGTVCNLRKKGKLVSIQTSEKRVAFPKSAIVAYMKSKTTGNVG